MAELIRELMGRAIEEEKIKVYLKKYQNKEITLRKLAKEFFLPLWKAYELAANVEFPYSKTDLQRDLKIIEDT